MALVIPNQGEVIALEAMLNKTAPENLDLCLYKNDVTPGETDTEATYTEADFTGYATIQLTAANWTVTPGNPTEAAYAQQTFTSSADQASQSVYGYFVKQRTSGKLVYAERFTNGPYAIANDGDAINVTPKITGE
jgi:hypothetical protein